MFSRSGPITSHMWWLRATASPATGSLHAGPGGLQPGLQVLFSADASGFLCQTSLGIWLVCKDGAHPPSLAATWLLAFGPGCVCVRGGGDWGRGSVKLHHWSPGPARSQPHTALPGRLVVLVSQMRKLRLGEAQQSHNCRSVNGVNTNNI